ncbi:MAG: hypothetical protein ABIR77_07995 [Sphingomicrobium sp.]
MTEYGSGGRIGIGTPQANPTVEPEMAILMPRSCTILATRLTSPAATSTERLVDYLEQLPATLATYDTLRPDIFGFACTGSSYLVGRAREAALVSAASDSWGRPIVTACRAIEWALARLGATRVALVAPYSGDLLAAGVAWWRAAGLDVVAVERVETGEADTRGIYALGGGAARAAIDRVGSTDVDAVLVSGTGMPSLAAIAGRRASSVPILSSNLALAGRLIDLATPGALPDDAVAPPGWQARLAEALSPPRPDGAARAVRSAP